jgi:hypothetical protein
MYPPLAAAHVIIGKHPTPNGPGTMSICLWDPEMDWTDTFVIYMFIHLLFHALHEPQT